MMTGKITRAIRQNEPVEMPLIRAYRMLLQDSKHELSDRLTGLDGLCFGCGYEDDRCKCTAG